MATELVKVCDFCATEDDTRTPNAETVAVTVGGVPYEVDVCERHRKPIDELGTWLAEHARKVTASVQGAPSLPYVCEVCGRGFSRPQGLTMHRMHSHADEAAPAEPEPKPVAAPKAPAPSPRPVRVLAGGRVECPMCHHTYKNRASLGVHAHAQHGTSLGALEGNPRKPRN